MSEPRRRRATTPDPELGPLTRDRLTRDVWLWQREKGHRFSVDDVATAFVALAAAPAATTILDLGCGIGSVLLHLAWSLPESTLYGIEAQAVSFALLERNVRDNQLGARVTVAHGDLRDPLPAWPAHYELVTGTPPYFPVHAALEAEDPQRAYARIEYRGGVEAYIKTAARHLAPDGRFVLCGDHRAEARVQDAAAAQSLALIARTDVIARAPNPPLFSIWTLAHAAQRLPLAPPETLTIRDRAGNRTIAAERLKAFSGL